MKGSGGRTSPSSWPKVKHPDVTGSDMNRILLQKPESGAGSLCAELDSESKHVAPDSRETSPSLWVHSWTYCSDLDQPSEPLEPHEVCIPIEKKKKVGVGGLEIAAAD